ncbi:MAG: hypothetical protein ACK5TQ_08205, partial [Acetobacteraceae bacterium]
MAGFVKGWRRLGGTLIAPFFQIKGVIALPRLGTKGILAEMRQGDRITSQHLSFLPGAAAVLHVIEIEIKPRIEAQALGTQGIAPRGLLHAIK